LRGLRSLAYYAAARQYDYGDERQRVAALSSRVTAQFLVPHLSLTVLVECGGDAEVLAFAGVTVYALVVLNRYSFEHVWHALRLTWQRLLLLDFKPELLVDCERFPLGVLLANGVRGEQLLDFYRTRDQLEKTLHADESALLGVNWLCWK
jgi:hypothetical protein